MVVKTKHLTPSEHLAQRLAGLDEEVECIRAKYGDPAEAMGAFLREWIGPEALQATEREYLRHEDAFLFDDYDLDEDEDEEVREGSPAPKMLKRGMRWSRNGRT